MIQTHHLGVLESQVFTFTGGVSKRLGIFAPMKTFLAHPRALQTVDFDPLVCQEISTGGYDQHFNRTIE